MRTGRYARAAWAGPDCSDGREPPPGAKTRLARRRQTTLAKFCEILNPAKLGRVDVTATECPLLDQSGQRCIWAGEVLSANDPKRTCAAWVRRYRISCGLFVQDGTVKVVHGNHFQQVGCQLGFTDADCSGMFTETFPRDAA